MQAPQEEIMDSVWSNLPKDIVNIVLLFLPLASAMQFKSVCKEWREFLGSNCYYRRRSAVEQKKPWLFLCTSGMFSCAFDFSLKRWHKILNPPLYRQSIVSASGNLVCLGNLVADCRALSICDPVSKLVKNLAPMNKIQFIHKVSLNLHKDGAYKIMVVGENDRAVNNFRGLVTEVYDSKTQIWRMSGETMAEAKFGLDAGVWMNSRFYCIVEMPYGVVVFDQKRDLWEELEAEMPAGCNDISSPYLVDCRGRLLMVMRNSIESGTSKFQIWELVILKEKEDYEWVLLEEMPEHIEVEFMASSRWGDMSQRLICCGVGDWVCIITQLSPSALAFNMVNKKWEWLGKDPAFPQGRNSHLYAFPLRPISHCQL
ncbi:hypothetical protein SUGI_0040910 [Cryptomeria japonica]|uniref:F-box/kelch-repeat protein At5g15710-like n=1 Tax=Cryptomeria japonica TaxID=3369 RepID=UPI0024089EB4|nr:F-box/kelch-repeat protein At5g15710-like [Cryptomeria japonica]GLJ06519.1 hypothetical protein SUGI_0040910 [Cryptomeria japonica]